MLARTLSIVALSAALCSSAMATTILEIEPNDSMATAQNVDGALPNAVINGTAASSYDFYSFSIVDAGLWSFRTFSNFDPELYLFDSAGNVLDGNDDAMGAEGSPNLLDAAFEHFFDTPGTYYIGLCIFNCYADNGGILTEGGTIEGRDGIYEIRISEAPEPLTFLLTGCGLLALGVLRRHRKQKA
jgi:hypothetical protein